MDLLSKIDYAEVAHKWGDLHKYSPATRHRRRLIMKLLNGLGEISNCLDVGCAQPFLIEEIQKRKNVRVAGCDISEKVILSNKKLYPNAEFFVMDVSNSKPDGKQYDLVICSEVLEHIDNWRTALQNISLLSRRWLIVTVPCGKVHPIDKYVGHIRHFQGDDIVNALTEFGFFTARVFRWGFPFHSLYKLLSNGIAPNKIYKSFAEERYGIGKRFISMLLYWLFYGNDFFNFGSQFIALMGKKD